MTFALVRSWCEVPAWIIVPEVGARGAPRVEYQCLLEIEFEAVRAGLVRLPPTRRRGHRDRAEDDSKWNFRDEAGGCGGLMGLKNEPDHPPPRSMVVIARSTSDFTVDGCRDCGQNSNWNFRRSTRHMELRRQGTQVVRADCCAKEFPLGISCDHASTTHGIEGRGLDFRRAGLVVSRGERRPTGTLDGRVPTMCDNRALETSTR